MDELSRIFLAHATEDKNRVRKLYKKLKEEGYAPWLAEEDLLPGQVWQDEIPNVIQHCKIFVACLSTQSINKQGYIQREFRLALNTFAEKPPNSIFFIPLKLDECDVPNLQIPDLNLNLRDIQWLDYWKPGGFAQLVRALKVQIPGTSDYQKKRSNQINFEPIEPEGDTPSSNSSFDISPAGISSIQQRLDLLIGLIQTQTPKLVDSEQAESIYNIQAAGVQGDERRQPRQKEVGNDKKKLLVISPYKTIEPELDKLIFDNSQITRFFRDHFFSDIRNQIVLNPKVFLQDTNQFIRFFNQVCNSTLRFTRTLLQNYFEVKGLEIGEDLSLTVYLLISVDEVQRISNATMRDDAGSLQRQGKHIVTVYRDPYTWENRLERREIKKNVYRVDENTVFNEIINKGKPKFSCNNLRELQLKGEYTSQQSNYMRQYNSLLAVPIRDNSGLERNFLCYGALTIDSINPRCYDLFDNDATFYIANNAANLLAVTLGILDVLSLFQQSRPIGLRGNSV